MHVFRQRDACACLVRLHRCASCRQWNHGGTCAEQNPTGWPALTPAVLQDTLTCVHPMCMFVAMHQTLLQCLSPVKVTIQEQCLTSSTQVPACCTVTQLKKPETNVCMSLIHHMYLVYCCIARELVVSSAGLSLPCPCDCQFCWLHATMLTVDLLLNIFSNSISSFGSCPSNKWIWFRCTAR
jgi:hypothetical protein